MNGFEPFGLHHLVIVLLTIALSIGLPIWANRRLTASGRIRVSRIMAAAISLSVVIWTIIRIYVETFDWREDLPLDICNSLALLVAVLLWNPKRGMHEVVYYIVLSGTLQGVLTPEVFDGFPHHNYLKYWIVHSGLVIYVVFTTVTLKLYPSWQGMFRALAWLNLYALGIHVVNLIWGTNFMYTMAKPPTASLMDLFGPWPWYLLVCEGIALVHFWITYVPVARWAPRRDPL